MTLKWCVLTGALMLAFVYATFHFQHAVQNPPGVYTRWYDGTLERVDVFYADGTLKSTTTYGDDGKTVLILAEQNAEGKMTHSKVRREDGTVDEKRYSPDGKILALETVWNADETSELMERQYYDNGQLHSEEISTANGVAITSLKVYAEDGQLTMYRHVTSNADQVTDEYDKGKLTEHSVFKANGDQLHEYPYPGTTIVSRRQTIIALTKLITIEFLDKSGTVVFSSSRTQNELRIVSTLYVNGKASVRQTAIGKDLLLSSVEQFDPATGKLLRKIDVDMFGYVSAVSHYRADGTLSTVKHISDNKVTSQDDYDGSGTKIIKSSAGGEAENIDQRLLDPVLPPQSLLLGGEEDEE